MAWAGSAAGGWSRRSAACSRTRATAPLTARAAPGPVSTDRPSSGTRAFSPTHSILDTRLQSAVSVGPAPAGRYGVAS